MKKNIITNKMVSEAARILERSSFCEMSPTIAEGLAREVLEAALCAGDASQFSGADGFLDYDPMPYELAIRASYAGRKL